MVGEVRPERRRLVEVAEQVLQIAIDEMAAAALVVGGRRA